MTIPLATIDDTIDRVVDIHIYFRFFYLFPSHGHHLKIMEKKLSLNFIEQKKKKYMQVACLDKYYSLSSNPLAKYENRNNDLYVTLFFFFLRKYTWLYVDD